MMHITNWILPIGEIVLVLYSPCQVPLLGSVFMPLDQCAKLADSSTTISYAQFALRLLLSLVEAVLLTQVFIGGTFYDVDGLLTGISNFVQECNLAFRKTEIDAYRKLQVVEKLLNDCVKGRIFPIVAFTLPALQVMTCFAVTKLHDKIGLSSLIIYLCLYIDVLIFNMLVFTGAGRVYLFSQTWIQKLAKTFPFSKLKTKTLKSFKPLRVEFGSNFVDPLTPLVIQHFCVNQTVSLLVLTSKSTKL